MDIIKIIKKYSINISYVLLNIIFVVSLKFFYSTNNEYEWSFVLIVISIFMINSLLFGIFK